MYNCLHGLKIIVVPPTKMTVNRSWKQRLFTRPWRPFTKTEEILVSTMRKGEMVFDSEKKILYCEEETKQRIMEEIDK